MRLSVGDKVRVYFYAPKTTHSFVEGIIDRNEISTFWGLSFSLQTTREVILGRETPTLRSLPYIIAYALETTPAGDEVLAVLRVIHGARRWPEGRWPEGG